ncbi:hypothetical protein [Oceanobacillus halotolerans]|uniref:hypothetical protein n=1 Tax=Oceanobacillus halotolerans TaxID=2663380 RepID=UPI0013D95BDA|nr:hypothetical protein [Oceanobacillus halotolerans]
MSDNKKVIHVKDLVIKADNVHIEPPQRQPRFDPIFGPPRRRVEHEEEVVESSSSHEALESSEEKDDEEDRGNRRRPFSWI